LKQQYHLQQNNKLWTHYFLPHESLQNSVHGYFTRKYEQLHYDVNNNYNNKVIHPCD
jgi:ribosomal protein S17E